MMRLALAAILLANSALAHDFVRVRALKSTSISSSSASVATSGAVLVSAPTTLNASLAAVCTPTECIQGANSLTAGAVVYTPVNSSYRATVLLPGVYTSSSSATANTSLLSFGTSSTIQVSTGFTGTGSLCNAYTVALEAGLTTYPSALFEGTPSYTPLSSSANSTSTASVESFLLSSNMWVVLDVGGASGSRVVAWDGVADVGNMVGGSGGVSIVDLQSSSCSTPCASGGVCMSNSTCVCQPGFAGATCNTCSPGFFGKTCSKCPTGCSTCDDGITGSGICLDSVTNITTAAVCDCINGVCASAVSSATCSCNAGWTTAANGTKCAVCASGYFPTASGDCLACDPSCDTCSGPTGTCLTCQGPLQAVSTDPTKCETSTAALANGTFVTCPTSTFYDEESSACVACNPLCASCFATGTTGCTSCRTPLALLNGVCVAMNSKTGVCDSAGSVQSGSSTAVGSNAGWVFDNTKSECESLPAKCTAGGIDNFGTTSTRSQLTCSACLAGTYLSNGECVSTCPTGTTVSTAGTSCVACDSTCATCSISTSFCATCADSTKLSLNGTCISGPSCPSGYFSPGNSTCTACHPDCATCGTTFDTCLTCPSSRPVLSSSSTCLQTCSSNEYYDNAKGACVTCDPSCETCSGAGDGACLSCSSTMKLSQGTCIKEGCTVVDGFGVCLSQLVTVAAQSVTSVTKTSTALPWWIFLLIGLGVLVLVGLIIYIWRRKEKKRRRLQTARFANDLGQKEVDLKLRNLPSRIAYPALPHAEPDSDENVPLTPRFVLTPEHSRDLWTRSPVTGRFAFAGLEERGNRWSASSYGSKASGAGVGVGARPLTKQGTGTSGHSDASARSVLTTKSGKKIAWGDRNPFKTSPPETG